MTDESHQDPSNADANAAAAQTTANMLGAAMSQRDVVMNSFEAQRQAVFDAVEEQRRAHVQPVEEARGTPRNRGRQAR